MSKIRQFLGNFVPEFLLFFVCLFLVFTNYAPNTWLIGWDNLLPEFNFHQDLIRNLFGVWSEYRGLGLLAGQAHMADLPRIVILGALHRFGVVESNVRYLWTFGMLFIGASGTTRLFRYLLKSKYDRTTTRLAAFLSGLFYIFNLSTLQLFFVPFDSFVTFYGFLPWLVLSFLSVLFSKKKVRSIIFLGIVSLLISPSFFIYTLTIPLALYLIPFFIERFTTRLLVPIFVFFSTQLYWLLPAAFFVFSGNAKMISLARINAISSPETLQRNLQFSGLNYVLQLKGYLFEGLDLAGDKYAPLLGIWRNHLSNPTTIAIQALLILITIFGFIFSFKQKLKHDRGLALATLVTIFFLMGASLPILSKIPLLGEALRSPFTKFSYSLALSYSIYFGIGSLLIMDLFSFLHHRFTYFLTAFSISIAFIIFMTPAFTGNLIAPTMRLKIPSEYTNLFDFFKKQDPATRIANFPQYTFWNWNYYNWGYRGSGFLWYGIKQPILDRAFDVWEKSNEEYYEEISSALYSENRKEFENLVDKYAINWILIDKNIIAPSIDIDLGNEKLLKIINSSSKFVLAENINDKILIYKTNIDQKVKNFLSVSTPNSKPQNPFSNLPLRPFSPGINKDTITLNSHLPDFVDSYLNIPSYSDTENLVSINISYKKTIGGLELRLQPILPVIKTDNKIVYPENPPTNYLTFTLPESSSGLILGLNEQYYEIQLPEEVVYQTDFYDLTTSLLPTQKNINLTLYANTPLYKLDLTSAFNQATPYQCYTNKSNRKIEKIVEGQSISLIGTDMVGCLSTPIPRANTLNQLLSLEFTYSSRTNTPANANITNQSLGGENSPQPLLPEETPTFSRIFAKPQLVPMQANLILEANEIKSAQEITYQNVQVNYLPQLGEANFILNYIPPQQITTNNFSVNIPITDSQYTVKSTPTDNHFLANAINCDNFNQGKFDRQTTTDGFIYTAINANSCDQFNLKNFPHGTNYAIIIDSKNISGLSPSLCLENHSTKRCDIFERLNNKLEKQLLIQPINNQHETQGYTLHLSNQSFGDRKTQNLIRSVTITPFPLNFLKQIGFSSDGGPTGDSSEVKPITNSTHPAEFLYTVGISSDGDPEGSSSEVIPQILNLYQTRSPYWKAMEVSETDLKLPTWKLILKVPLLYIKNYKLQPITTYDANDSWHNIWSVPPGTHNLVVFYLPQYLEFVGFMLLPLPFLGTITYLVYKHIKPGQKK